ncbi:MAG: SRPBCC family protein [Steroidobacteraceae bacterium]|nr:SRPBCC family protein [Steroidobacteraceae bacterium]
MNYYAPTALIALLMPAAVPAAVTQSSPDGAIIEHHFTIAAEPAVAWGALVHPERWWPSDHTWSGDRANLRLEAQAGGCFCENWGEASAEHARVIMAQPGSLLRMRGALGPLQDMAVTGVLTIQLKTTDSGGTEATVTYRLSGDASHKLDTFVPVVDKVIGQQFGAFAAFASAPPKPAL